MTITINARTTTSRADIDAGMLASIVTGSHGPFCINGTLSGLFATDIDLGTVLDNIGHPPGPMVINGRTDLAIFPDDVDAGAILQSILSTIPATQSAAVFSANGGFKTDIDVGDSLAALAGSPGPFSTNGAFPDDQDIGSLLGRLFPLHGPLVVNGPLQMGEFSDDIDAGELLLQLLNPASVDAQSAVFSVNGSNEWPFEGTLDAGYLLSRIVGDDTQVVNGPLGTHADIGSVLLSIAGRDGNLTVNGRGVPGDIDVGELLLQLIDMLGIGILTEQGLEEAIGAYVTEDYLKNIGAWFRGNSPKFVDSVRAAINPTVTLQQFLVDLPGNFDLDNAIGAQLDAVGQWAGRSRYVNTPLEGVYFSFDTTGVGFDHGLWRGPFDVSEGVDRLDDETYRLLLRGKIAANNWDGTMDGAIAALGYIFNDQTIPGSRIFIQDYQDMSILIGVSGRTPSALFLSILGSGEIPIKPEGVNAQYAITTVDGAQIFGMDVNNKYIGGFDAGAWPELFT